MCAICVIELMTDSFLRKNSSCEELACKLAGSDLALRKATVLASLKKDIIESAETELGYAYKFNGSDVMIDRLCEFIKTERQCCDFFTFSLTLQKESSPVCLEITGPQGAKEFIKTELGL
jgi:hypothetical protein